MTSSASSSTGCPTTPGSTRDTATTARSASSDPRSPNGAPAAGDRSACLGTVAQALRVHFPLRVPAQVLLLELAQAAIMVDQRRVGSEPQGVVPGLMQARQLAEQVLI